MSKNRTTEGKHIFMHGLVLGSGLGLKNMPFDKNVKLIKHQTFTGFDKKPK